MSQAGAGEDLFGELRSLLQRAPSARHWVELCEHLDRFDEVTATEEVLPYVKDHLGRWPDDLRVAPRRWLEQAMEGHYTPALMLARQISWEGVTNTVLGAEDFWGVGPFVELREQAVEPGDVMVTVDPLDLERIKTLAASYDLTEVRALSLSRNALDTAAICALVQIEGLFTGLERLDLDGNVLGEEGVQALLSVLDGAALRELTLDHAMLGSAGARLLFSREWPSLTRLSLESSQIGPSGLHGLEELELPALKTLRLPGNPLGDDGARWLLECRALRGVEALDLTDCSLHAGVVHALLESPHLDDLRQLRLGLNVIPHQAQELLFEHPHLSRALTRRR